MQFKMKKTLNYRNGKCCKFVTVNSTTPLVSKKIQKSRVIYIFCIITFAILYLYVPVAGLNPLILGLWLEGSNTVPPLGKFSKYTNSPKKPINRDKGYLRLFLLYNLQCCVSLYHGQSSINRTKLWPIFQL